MLLASIFLIPTYFVKIQFHDFKTNIFEISVFISLILTILSLFSTKPRNTIKLGSIWAFLFIFSAAVAIFLSNDLTKAVGIFKGWFFVPYILYLLIINIFSKKDFPKIAGAILLSALLVSVWAIMQKFGVRHFFSNQNDSELQSFLNRQNPRVFSIFESPNYLAMFLAPIIFISLMLFRSLKKINLKILVLIPVAVLIITLYLTDSRSGMIALLVSAAFLSIKFLLKKQNLIRYILLIFIILITGNAIYYFMKIDIHPSSETGRQKIYSYSTQMVKAHPILGVGLGGYVESLANTARNDKEFLVYFLPDALHPHNLYLAIWLNLGLAGMILFIILLAKFFINISEEFDSDFNVIIFSAILTILIQGILDTTYFKNDLSAIFWLLGAMSYLAKKPDSKIIHNLAFSISRTKFILDW